MVQPRLPSPSWLEVGAAHLGCLPLLAKARWQSGRAPGQWTTWSAAPLANYEHLLNKVEGSFTCGSPWTFGGVRVHRQTCKTVVRRQHHAGPRRLRQGDGVGCQGEHGGYRALGFESRAGDRVSLWHWQLQWLSGTTRGDISADTSLLQRPPKELQVSDLKEVNAVLRYVKATSQASVKIEPVPLEELMFVCYGDFGFANAPNHKSQGGLVIAATSKSAMWQTTQSSLLEWNSYRHQRMCSAALLPKLRHWIAPMTMRG